MIHVLNEHKGDAERKRVLRKRKTAHSTEETVRTSKAVDLSSPPTTQQSFNTTHGSKFLRQNIRMINPLNTKCRLLYLKTQFVPRSKHFSSLL